MSLYPMSSIRTTTMLGDPGIGVVEVGHDGVESAAVRPIRPSKPSYPRACGGGAESGEVMGESRRLR